MKVLIFYVPVDHKETVKEAVFSAGAGKFKGYDYCSFETLGTGQFRPLQGSSPFLGSVNQLESVSEMRVEMMVDDELVESVKAALIESHPYETVAYHFLDVLI